MIPHAKMFSGRNALISTPILKYTKNNMVSWMETGMATQILGR